jgi:hypothetical protein
MAKHKKTKRKKNRLDAVTLEVIRNALPAIANEMAADLQRTSYNMMIYEVRDFCTSLVNTKGELISQNVGGVSHFVADLGVIITDAMARFGAKGFAPGDVIITNHQAVAGQHLNNIVIYTPYFYKGELLMFAMVRAHWIDIGGMSTGFGAGPTVADPWQEGLQLDQLKIYERGKLNETLYRVLKDNIRFPESSLGDMKSQMAACHLAVRRMTELFDKYGKDTIVDAIAQIFDETERKCRNVVEKLADGVYEAGSFIDDDGVTRGERVPIHAKVTVDHGSMTIDLSATSGERKAAVNSRTYAGARVAYKALTGPLEPVNEGSFRALKVIIPEGNIMMAKFPASTPSSGRSPRPCRTGCRPAITACSAAPSCSSVCIRRRNAALSCRASRAAAGAGDRPRTACRARFRSARATCATPRSRASSSNARCWWKAARCARIPPVPASTAAGWASTPACATWSRVAGISIIPSAWNVRPGGCGAARPARPPIFCCASPARTISAPWMRSIIRCRSIPR